MPSGSSTSPEKRRGFERTPNYGASGEPAGARKSPFHMNGGSQQETPLGAIHVDAMGIVLEHRPLEAGEPPAEAPSMVGRKIASIASWASEPAFVSALKSVAAGASVSFHFDFPVAASSGERMIHVNILPVGDKTSWIFITDKTFVS